MHCLMTMETPQFPSVAGRMTADEPLGMAYGLVPKTQQRWTFGYKLVDRDPNNAQTQALQAQYGIHLCQVVARCLMNRQEHRPNLQQLQDWIMAALTPPAAPVPAAWKAAWLGNPRPPRAPWQVVDAGTRNSDIDPFWDYGRGVPVPGV